MHQQDPEKRLSAAEVVSRLQVSSVSSLRYISHKKSSNFQATKEAEVIEGVQFWSTDKSSSRKLFVLPKPRLKMDSPPAVSIPEVMALMIWELCPVSVASAHHL